MERDPLLEKLTEDPEKLAKIHIWFTIGYILFIIFVIIGLIVVVLHYLDYI